MDIKEITDFLASCDIFHELNRDKVEKIAGLTQMKSYSAGENIFCQGETGENLYIIIEGSVFLERAIDLGNRKGRAVISVIGKGRALGCWSTLLGKSHEIMSYANCRKPTKALIIKGAELNKLMLQDHEMGFKISRSLCSLLINRIEGAYGAMDNI